MCLFWSGKVSRISVVQSPSHVQLFATLWATAHQASLSLTISWSLPKFMSFASWWWCHPAISSSDTFSFCPQSFPASGPLKMSQLLASFLPLGLLILALIFKCSDFRYKYLQILQLLVQLTCLLLSKGFYYSLCLKIYFFLFFFIFLLFLIYALDKTVSY